MSEIDQEFAEYVERSIVGGKREPWYLCEHPERVPSGSETLDGSIQIHDHYCHACLVGLEALEKQIPGWVVNEDAWYTPHEYIAMMKGKLTEPANDDDFFEVTS